MKTTLKIVFITFAIGKFNFAGVLRKFLLQNNALCDIPYSAKSLMGKTLTNRAHMITLVN